MVTKFEGIEYTREMVYAPCYGTNHDHARRIGKCPTCSADVVLYRGRILDAKPRLRESGAAPRKFTCWNDSHKCVTAPVVTAEDRERYRALETLISNNDGILDYLEEQGMIEQAKALRSEIRPVVLEYRALCERVGVQARY